MPRIRIGSRGSALALHQTNWVAERIRHLHPGLEVEVEVIRTKGDKILDVPLAKIGDKGLFVKELENALLAREIDLAVHSMKDLPTALPNGLCIAAVPERVDPHDVLISKGPGLFDLPGGSCIGTSSLRRRAQVSNVRRDLQFRDLRGNLDTRLRKLDEGEYDAIILARAGLERMGWAPRVTEMLPFEICLPAVGQGALAVETRADDADVLPLLAQLEHAGTRRAVVAERSLMAALEGGCQVPIGAYAFIDDSKLRLMGVVASLNGDRLIRGEVSGDQEKPEELGGKLAQMLLSGGAGEILGEAKEEGGRVME